MQVNRSITIFATGLLLLFASVFRSGAQGAGESVTCVVSDPSGPVPGVVVRIKGSDAASMTDLDGVAVIRGVKSGVTLVVSMMGFRTEEVQATPGQTIGVSLQEDSELLDEVVVI